MISRNGEQLSDGQLSDGQLSDRELSDSRGLATVWMFP